MSVESGDLFIVDRAGANYQVDAGTFVHWKRTGTTLSPKIEGDDVNAVRYYLQDATTAPDTGIAFQESPTENIHAVRVLTGTAHSGSTTDKVLNLGANNGWAEVRVGSYLKVNGFKNTFINTEGGGDGSFRYLSRDGEGEQPAQELANYSMVADYRIGCEQLDVFSDRRLKEAITPIRSDDAIRFIETVNPVTFAWKDDIKQTDNPDAVPTSIGYIAQEVGRAGFAELVSSIDEDMRGAVNAEDSDPETHKYTVNYASAVPLLHQALKDALARIEALETEVQALKAVY